ncbi:HNH endonuclease [Acinetobacter brisouii]|uniref:HNH endonuclease n=1 Tax=Acinetobacter brisouii TaxID=396323 RepID=UPI0035B0928E
MTKRPPQRAYRPCLVGSCKEYATNAGYCDKHQNKIRKKDRERGTAHQRGYGAEWNKKREAFLNQNPLCCDCKKRGYIVPATVVDHIIPHKGDKVLFWDETNWQPLCEACHNRKTATEDRGGWSYKAPVSKANRESVNKFEVGQVVVTATDYIRDALDCDDKEQFTITEVDGKTIHVSNGLDGGRYHHSHFKAVQHE